MDTALGDGAALSDGAAELLRRLRGGRPVTRAGVGAETGWARATVNARLDELLATGLVVDAGVRGGSRGRPAGRFVFNAARGGLLIADVGASAARLAHCDLGGGICSQTTVDLDIRDGPDRVLELVTSGLASLPTRDELPAWAMGMSLPGPVEHPTGRIVSPPMMTGWDGVTVPALLEPRLGVPVLVENDVNAMVWGEHVLAEEPLDDLLLVKVGTGIGAGLVTHGQILRGARGSAGDLGHTHTAGDVTDREPPLCRCGKLGCLEAYAGGWALARDLVDDGLEVADVRDVVAALQAGDPRAVRRVREAGRVLGIGIADAVSLLNPSEVVVSGGLAVAGEHLLSGIRERVAAFSLPLATTGLRIRVSSRPHDVGVVGMADLVARWALDPARVNDVLARVGAPT
ncbi:ROK family protein [Pseudokineococcus marinus]|uniref:ROK family protein n=2 Tax=Pseudokineococcus marinus TaxID=351215 RepID=A0A849BJS2_9ACTN|nr:ROK family protein [Pseudokineococcus marinus]NNH21605.1 ROK family protein [Pseudokineococcus marinus]